MYYIRIYLVNLYCRTGRLFAFDNNINNTIMKILLMKSCHTSLFPLDKFLNSSRGLSESKVRHISKAIAKLPLRTH